MSQSRQLAAIMFTDIVGYTKLMGEDEQKAFELLKKNRLVQKPLIEKYNGKWLKEIGDGVLASFSTVTDAVYCAATIQKTCENEPDLRLRIGIHLGEVVFEGNDVFGDGVNIASRLEPLAPIGGILVSESVNRDLGNKKGIGTTFLREETLKNVKDPIKVYEVKVEGIEVPELAETLVPQAEESKLINSRKAGLTSLTVIIVLALAYFFYSQQREEETRARPTEVIDKSIAVLPFANDSPDPDNEYFCNGMFDEIITHLQKIGELKVKSRTSVEQYRNPDRDIREIAEELEAAFLVEGSVRKAGDDLRITVQLIDAKTGDHLWAETYDGKYTDKIFDFQSNIAKQVAASLNAVITPDEARIESVPTSDLTAYDFYLRGLDYSSRGYQEDNLRFAIQMYERAVEIDSNFTLAWVGLTAASRNIYWYEFDRSEEHFAQIEQYLAKATSLDPDLLEVQHETGMYYYHCRLNYSKALQILEKLKSDYPNNGRLHATIGYVYRRMGEFELALEYNDRAISLNSSVWSYWWTAGETSIMLGRYTEAEDYLKTAIDLNPSALAPLSTLAWKHLRIGEVDKARTLLEKIEIWWIRSNIELIDRNYQEAIQILESSPREVISGHMQYTLKSLRLGLIYYVMSDRELANKHFHEARKVLEEKLSELPNDSRLYSSLGIVYAGLGMTEEAMAAGNKALTILNMSVDAYRGFYREFDMAQILLMTGEHDEAIEKLEFLIQRNGLLSVEILKIDPLWDPLREITAFKALIENPKYQIDLEDV